MSGHGDFEQEGELLPREEPVHAGRNETARSAGSTIPLPEEQQIIDVAEPVSVAAADSVSRPKARQPELLGGRFELAQPIRMGSPGQSFRAVDRDRVQANLIDPFTTIVFFPSTLTPNPGRLEPCISRLREWLTLGHPHLVQCEDIFREHARPFLTLEHLQGILLAERMADAINPRLDKDAGLNILNALGGALVLAHARKLVHGLLCPGVIWLQHGSNAKLCDPGLAALLTADNDSANTLRLRNETLRYSVAARYQSPETIVNPETVTDGRADVFALACLGYELLTGQHPFGGLASIDAQFAERRVAQLAPLNHRQWQAFNNALAFKASARTPTVQAFLAELNGVNPPLWKNSVVIGAALGVITMAGVMLLPEGSSNDNQPAQVEQIEPVQPKVVKATRRHNTGRVKAAARTAESDKAPVASVQPEPTTPIQVAAAPAVVSKQERIRLLLQRGDSQLNSMSLIEPQGDSAYETYLELLKLAPDDPMTRQGIQVLDRHLLNKAKVALYSRGYDQAKDFLKRVETLDPKAEGLDDLKQKLSAIQ